MPRANNPTLGTIACTECGDPADVCQTQRGKGRFLYTRCGNCGTLQLNGKAPQTRLYYGTQWRDGVAVERPPNVEERTGTTAQALGSQPETEPEQEPETTEIEPVTEPEPEPKGKAGGLAILAGVLAVVFFPFGGGK